MTILSSIPWIQQYKSRLENHEEILHHLAALLEEQQHSSSELLTATTNSIDNDKSPVNILISDGGAIRGKKHHSCLFLLVVL